MSNVLCVSMFFNVIQCVRRNIEPFGRTQQLFLILLPLLTHITGLLIYALRRLFWWRTEQTIVRQINFNRKDSEEELKSSMQVQWNEAENCDNNICFILYAESLLKALEASLHIKLTIDRSLCLIRRQSPHISTFFNFSALFQCSSNAIPMPVLSSSLPVLHQCCAIGSNALILR